MQTELFPGLPDQVEVTYDHYLAYRQARRDRVIDDVHLPDAKCCPINQALWAYLEPGQETRVAYAGISVLDNKGMLGRRETSHQVRMFIARVDDHMHPMGAEEFPITMNLWKDKEQA